MTSRSGPKWRAIWEPKDPAPIAELNQMINLKEPEFPSLLSPLMHHSVQVLFSMHSWTESKIHDEYNSKSAWVKHLLLWSITVSACVPPMGALSYLEAPGKDKHGDPLITPSAFPPTLCRSLKLGHSMGWRVAVGCKIKLWAYFSRENYTLCLYDGKTPYSYPHYHHF